MLASFNTDWSDLGVALAIVVGAAFCGILFIDLLAAVAGAYLASAAAKRDRRRGWLLGLPIGVTVTLLTPVVCWYSMPFTWSLAAGAMIGVIAAFASGLLIASQSDRPAPVLDDRTTATPADR